MRLINWFKNRILSLWSKIPRINGRIDIRFIGICLFIGFLIYQLFFGIGGGSEYCDWSYDTDC
jgi:hypothetical protein